MVGELAVGADVFHTLLVGSVGTRPCTIPFPAIVTETIAAVVVVVVVGLGADGVGCARGDRLEAVGLRYVEALDLTEIVFPSGETGLNAIQNGGVE